VDNVAAVISEIRIRNFKSIHDLTLKPGRVTVLIGENGSGKSNILEGIGFAAAAAANKLDGEFLFNRGIRVTDWKWMVSAFLIGDSTADPERDISLDVSDDDLDETLTMAVWPEFVSEDGSFSGWNIEQKPTKQDVEAARHLLSEAERLDVLESVKKDLLDSLSNEKFRREIEQTIAKHADEIGVRIASRLSSQQRGAEFMKLSPLADFLIYAPENTVLRTPPPEGAIQPVGTKGEGLFWLLQTFADPKNAERLADLKERLRLFGWFDDFLVPDESATAQARIQIRDKWLAPERAIFDQRSANEGFLYLLFYFTVIMSARTPRFFAFDNVDNALNPKLCSTLMKQITELAKKYGKQVICTTHNAAILDGLDLEDDDVRLFTVRRDSEGHTALHRVKAPKPQPGETPVRLSEAFMRGILGGLPDHF
jgi:energy-coupling factor transporter ATP-binding protein EcfA2